MEQLALKDIFARMLRQKEENPQKPAAATDAAILIVDDSRTIVHAFKTMLEGAGYQTLSALDGVQAVHVAKHQLPDLILMDIQLPKISGLDVIRRLRTEAATAATPIVALTSFALSGDDQKAKDAGATAYLTKPFSPLALLALIRNLLPEAQGNA